jgi:hypothetical protein
MSTSRLYHAFGARDYRDVKTQCVEGEVIFTVERNASTRSGDAKTIRSR